MSDECGCYRCAKERVEADPDETFALAGLDLRLTRMFVCAICGNKRCPHATDHRHACTGSNEPGQRGSAYENAWRATPIT